MTIYDRCKTDSHDDSSRNQNMPQRGKCRQCGIIRSKYRRNYRVIFHEPRSSSLQYNADPPTLYDPLHRFPNFLASGAVSPQYPPLPASSLRFAPTILSLAFDSFSFQILCPIEPDPPTSARQVPRGWEPGEALPLPHKDRFLSLVQSVMKMWLSCYHPMVEVEPKQQKWVSNQGIRRWRRGPSSRGGGHSGWAREG